MEPFSLPGRGSRADRGDGAEPSAEPAPEPALAPEPDDAEADRLVLRAQAGDKEAFGKLYSLYFDRVFSLVRLILRDEEEARDASQDVFVKAMKALPGYQVRAGMPFRAWLFRIARNHAINHFQKSKRLELEEPAKLDQRRKNEVDQDLLQALGWARDSQILFLVEYMPAAQRQVVILRYLMDLSWDEVAQVMGKTSAAVRQLHHRAIAFLRARLIANGWRPDREGTRLPSQTVFRQATVVRARRFILGPQ